jgi:hypothetical protein
MEVLTDVSSLGKLSYEFEPHADVPQPWSVKAARKPIGNANPVYPILATIIMAEALSPNCARRGLACTQDGAVVLW